ncbi:hypothetical protein GCM10010270_79950 [Streptomyces violaceus]|nr:hypothetical protein GCM10010270_79950 [Streptomyces janthinus]
MASTVTYEAKRPQPVRGGRVRREAHTVLRPDQQRTGRGRGDPLGKPRPPRDPSQLGDQFWGVPEGVRHMPASVVEQPLPGTFAGEH